MRYKKEKDLICVTQRKIVFENGTMYIPKKYIIELYKQIKKKKNTLPLERGKVSK